MYKDPGRPLWGLFFLILGILISFPAIFTGLYFIMIYSAIFIVIGLAVMLYKKGDIIEEIKDDEVKIHDSYNHRLDTGKRD